MQANRPPRKIPAAVAAILLTLPFSRLAALDDFVLPDLVYQRLTRPDVPQPENFPDPAVNWTARLPGYRRLYPLQIMQVSGPNVPEAIGLPDKMPEVPFSGSGGGPMGSLKEENRLLPGRIPVPRQGWSAGGSADPREGLDIGAAVSIPGFGVLGTSVFTPFVQSGYRSWSGEVNWTKMGSLRTDVRIGVKDDDGITPWGTGRIDWLEGIASPDSYEVNLHSYGTSDFGFSGIAGMSQDFPVKNSLWSVIAEINAGGWASAADSADSSGGGMARGALAAAFVLPDADLNLKAGADVYFSSEAGFGGAPFIGLIWSPERVFRLFADSRVVSGYPVSVDNTLGREKLNGFLPELPVNSRYRAGIEGSSNAVDYRLETAYAGGTFAFAEETEIVTLPDRRISGSAHLDLGFEKLGLAFSGLWDISVDGQASLWESRGSLILKKISMYIEGGSRDSILSTDLPGIRGENPIMGIGFDWLIRSGWDMSLFAYAGIPWDEPSIKFSLNWRDS
jgi:hypothetical protein